MAEQDYDLNDDDDDGVLDPSDSLESDDLRSDPLDTGIDAGDGYEGATRFGTTADEEARGESLDDLLAEEEPDDALDDDEWNDEEQPRDEGATSAEEAAVHLTDDPPFD